MDAANYTPQLTPRLKKRKFNRIFIIVFAISLFFLQGRSQTFASPADAVSTPPTTLDNLTSYLTVPNDTPNPLIYAKSYLLMESETTEVIIGKNFDLSVPIASTTKMATALLARQLYSLDEVVTVKRFTAGIGGSTIGLVYQEKVTVGDLLKGLLIQSGNDAAFALAQHYSNQKDDYQSFVAKMNEFVKEHGLNNTVFGDPAGLDDEIGRSTALDLAHLARLLLNDPVLADIVKTNETTIYSTNRLLSHDLISSNRLLDSSSPYYLPRAIGVKTGFTLDAGHCLVSAYQSKHGLLIGVVLNTIEFTTTASADESQKLHRWADYYVENKVY
ncbi:MAG: hypothetical protein WD544_02105 [Patescibacteria group bacterium]